jgi:hypothetical protein
MDSYGLEPMTKTGAAASAPFACEIGLVQIVYNGNRTVPGDYIPLRKAEGNIFETSAPVKKGARFKMEVKNSTECYIYVFGKETDGTTYTLFPYPREDDPTKTKYSPFCGIAGYRLFPKNKSMSPDSIGIKDEMAVIVSKEPLDWYALNKQISQDPRKEFAARLTAALSDKLIRNTRFQTSAKGNMQFTVDADNGDNKKAVVTIVEIDKQ